MRLSRLLSVLLLAVSLPLSAGSLPAEEMTTAEIVQELNQIFSEQQTDLIQLEAGLETSQQALTESRQELSLLKKDLQMQQQELSESIREVTELKSYLPNLIEEQQKTISSQKTWLWVLSGVAAALAVSVALAYVI